MQLKYRGISYDVPDTTVEVSSQESVQGLYHGLTIQIALPQMTEGIDELLSQMIYRGIRLTTG